MSSYKTTINNDSEMLQSIQNAVSQCRSKIESLQSAIRERLRANQEDEVVIQEYLSEIKPFEAALTHLRSVNLKAEPIPSPSPSPSLEEKESPSTDAIITISDEAVVIKKMRGSKKLAEMTSDERAAHETKKAEKRAAKDGASTVSAVSPAPSTGSKKKVKDSNAPKREINPKIVALNEERMKVYAEMQASYFEANPSALGIEPKEIRKMAKEGKMPPFPTYPQALKEHSKRMCDADPEHAQKHADYRIWVAKRKQARSVSSE